MGNIVLAKNVFLRSLGHTSAMKAHHLFTVHPNPSTMGGGLTDYAVDASRDDIHKRFVRRVLQLLRPDQDSRALK